MTVKTSSNIPFYEKIALVTIGMLLTLKKWWFHSLNKELEVNVTENNGMK